MKLPRDLSGEDVFKLLNVTSATSCGEAGAAT